jgi:NADH-quinone oxidoreductase subunit F
MDLRLPPAPPSVAERDAVDRVLGEPPAASRAVAGGHAARERRHLLLPALHALHDAAGTISRGGVAYVSRRLTVPPADIYGVASFYALFDVDGEEGATVHVCDDIACPAAEVDALLAGTTDARVERSPCLGQCDRAPAVLHHRPGTGFSVTAPAPTIDADTTPGPALVHQDRSDLRLLRRVGRIDPTSLADYRASGGFSALEAAIEWGPASVIDELDASGLRGRGGAAFPVGRKWAGVRDAAGTPKYVVANGDESEPGTFKDRVLMEGDPFAVVEALAMYGFVTGATRAYIYVRAEYPAAVARLEHAIAASTDAGLVDLPIEVRRGGGAYVCGEETALFASIEGYRGEPRQKPPYPNQAGLFGRPTGINNIETLVATLDVIDRGGAAYARTGTEGSTGTKLFCLSGAVADPGVYEVPFGATTRDLIALAGGIRGDAGLGAVLLGGAAGVFVDEESLDVPLTFEGTREAGLTIGSGAVVVFDDRTDFGRVVSRIARFFREESCGQCVPCRVGTVRQEESLGRLLTGSSRDDEVRLIDDLARAMDDTSICGLGRTASTAVRSAIDLGLVGRG